LLNGDFTFCPTYDFNDLSMAIERDRQLLRDELYDKPWTTAYSERVLEDFEGLGMPSRNCFDLLVKTIVVLSYVIACPGLNFIYDVVVLEFFGGVSDHAWRTMFDEFNDSSILKTPRSLPATLFSGDSAQGEPIAAIIAQAI
jgi:hypothetical protein